MTNTKMMRQFNVYNLGILPLRAGDDGANIAKTCNEEGNGLKEQVYEVVVLPMDIIIASTDEEESSKSQLQCVEPVQI
jgi:hypothetical protein